MADKNTYNEDLVGSNLPDSLRVTPFVVPDNFFKHQQEAIYNQLCVDLIFSIASEEEPTVPAGYFEGLESNIFARIAEADLKDQIQDSGFEAPVDYFSEFENSIQARIAEQQLKASVQHDGFEVPSNYFEELTPSIEARLAEVKLKDQVTTDGFATPMHYFDELEMDIQSKLLTEQLRSKLSTTGFETPSDYFQQMNTRILEKISDESTTDQSPTETPIVQLPRRTSWVKYAAAAVLLFAGAGSYLALQDSTDVVATNEFANVADQNLQHVSDEEILNYLAQVSEDNDLIQLTQFADDPSNGSINLDSQIENEDIEEYLNYLL
jgi:hypothetical protein